MYSWLIFQPRSLIVFHASVGQPTPAVEMASITKGGRESLARSGGTYTAQKSETRVSRGARTANRHR